VPSPRRISLSTWPTPLEPAPRLAAALGLRPDDLWVKRDDLSGLGGGGNKIRKLEYTCAAAVDAGAEVLVSSGAPQSNHARLTAAAGARLGLAVTLVLEGEPPSAEQGNLVLDRLLGADVVWAGEVDAAGLAAAVEDRAQQLRDAGRRVHVIPFGGSSPLAAHGYLDGARELEQQEPELDHLVVALGSGGTMAGLVAGFGPERVLGVHTGAVADAEATVRTLLAGMGVPADGALRLRLDQVGAGYATLTEPVLEAQRLAARTEGLVLDPTYTGRALAGLVAAVADGEIQPGQRVVFLHTGGLPGLFGHPDTARIAEPAL
jgi:L-cysteate sulfo-lyase